MSTPSTSLPLSVRELRILAHTGDVQRFVDAFGPFILVQAPTSEELKRLAVSLGRRSTMMEDKARADGFQLTADLDALVVKALPKLKSRDILRVGRTDDCQIVIEDPTVSKHHATVHWDQPLSRFTVVDNRSRNGTFLNGMKVTETRLGLDNGDLVSFGSAHFLYFRTESLHARLRGEDDGSFIIERGG